MTTAIKRRRGTTAEHATFTGLEGELTVDTTKDTVVVHDGSTAGGSPLAKEDGSTMTNVDINSGTIDGTTIGGTTAAAGTFTNLTATGTVTVDGLTVDGDAAVSSANPRIRLFETDTTDLNTQLQNNGGEFVLKTLLDDASNSTTRIKVAHSTGDISFYADDGTTQGLFWDASTKRLGLGTTSPSKVLDVRDNDATGTTTSSNRVALFATNGTGKDAHITFSNLVDSPASIGNRGALYFDYNNTERMRIDSSGNVGINNTTPASYLEGELVVGNSTKDQYINVVTGTGHAAGLCFQDTTGTSIVGGFRYTHSDNALASWTNGSERLRIDSIGRVAVGTTTPHTTDSLLTLQNSSGVAELNITSGTSGASLINMGDTGDYNIGRIKYDQSTNSMQFNTNNAERMRITSDGKCGIGTSSPADELHINSTAANVNLRLTRDTNTGCRVSGSDGGTTPAFIVETIASGTATEQMRIDAGGSMLVGTTTPTDLHNTWRHIIVGDKGAIISQDGAGGVPGMTIADNVYVDADTGGFAYQTTDQASKLTQEAGVLTFSNAGSGTAGAALSLTERLRIDSSGKVMIGTTTPGGTNANNLTIENTSGDAGMTIRTGSTNGSKIFFADGTSGSATYRGYIVYNHSADRFEIGTAGSERMRIKSNGRVSVGLTGDIGPAIMQLDGGSGCALGIRAGNGTGGYFNQVLFANNGNTALIGSIQRVNNASIQYNTTSDARLKENIADMTGAITRVKQLAPKRYSWVEEDLDAADQDGFLAHETQTVVPMAVSGRQDEVDSDGNPVYMQMDYSKLVPLLTGALKEAIAKIETLETEMTALKERVTALGGA